MRFSRAGVLLGLVLVLAGCSTKSAPRAPRAAARDRNLITAEEMRDRNYINAYDAIAAMRPNWLTARGADSFNNPTQVRVYFDTADMGSVSALRSFAPTSFSYVRYYSGTEATARWGPGHGEGVIFISSHDDHRDF
jgi:hypothetical protein